jgi:NTP pyrophosphatase (non-canonical NTP hydrolase)
MDRLDALRRELRAFVVQRNWQPFHDPKNLAMALASEVGELVAEYRWIANSHADRHSRLASNRRRIAAEAADVGILLVLFCDRVGIDLVGSIKQKLVVNRRNYPVRGSRGRWQRP